MRAGNLKWVVSLFAILSGIHLIGLLLGPIGYSIAPPRFLNAFFFLIYLATIVVLKPFYAIGLPVFAKIEATWPEPTLLGSVLATLVWFGAYLGVAYLATFAASAIRRKNRSRNSVKSESEKSFTSNK